MITALPPIFAGLAPEYMNEAAEKLVEIHFSPGETMVEAGELDFSLAFLVKGHVQIIAQGVVVGTAGPRDLIGEAEMFSQVPRMASVVAMTDVLLHVLPIEAYLELCETGNPVVQALERAVLRKVGERLQAMNEFIAGESEGAPLVLPEPEKASFFGKLTASFRRAPAAPEVDGAAVLLASDVFQWADPELLAELGGLMHARAVHTGEVLCEQGASADMMFVVVSGEFDVFIVQKPGFGEHVAKVVAGRVFGDVGLATGLPRTATVVASADGVVLTLARDHYQELFDADAASASAFRQSLIRNQVMQLIATQPRQIQLLSRRLPTEEQQLRGTPVSTLWRD